MQGLWQKTSNPIVLRDPPLDILVFRTGAHLCALPIRLIRETMRTLPTRPMSCDLPAYLGLSLIRGKACPVLDLATLIGCPTPAKRLILLNLPQDRTVALAVTSVEGVNRLRKETLGERPPLLDAMPRDIVEKVCVLDGELCLVLREGTLLSEQDWSLVGA